jgi:hypothetical protein
MRTYRGIHPGDVVWFSPAEKHLARCHANDVDDAHRDSGKARREGCRLDGTGQRRTIPGRSEVSYH